MANPLHQFEVQPIIPIHIGNVDASYTNSALFMTVAVVLITVFSSHERDKPGTGARSNAIVRGTRLRVRRGMLRTNVGPGGKAYFPFIFSLFYFILLGNMLGMLPYGYTFTAQLVVTLGLALLIFIGTTIIGFLKHGVRFFGLFLPHGTPWYIAPILVPIEIISYCFRPISLSLRLFANMTAGHTLLKVFAGFIGAFVASIGVLGILPGLIPLVAVIGLTGLEFLVAFLQAYVYTVLACIYLNDALHLH